MLWSMKEMVIDYNNNNNRKIKKDERGEINK